MLKDLISDTKKVHHLGPEGRFSLAQFEASWRKSGMNAKPAEPSGKLGLGMAQPNSFILQQIVPGAGRIRIVGQQLFDILDMEPRGMSFGALFTERSRETALELMDAAFSLPSLVSIPLTAKRGPMRRPVKAEVILLPLWDASGKTTHIMGALVLDRHQHIGRLEFDIVNDVPFRCDPLDHPNPDRRANGHVLTVVN